MTTLGDKTTTSLASMDLTDIKTSDDFDNSQNSLTDSQDSFKDVRKSVVGIIDMLDNDTDASSDKNSCDHQDDEDSNLPPDALMGKLKLNLMDISSDEDADQIIENAINSPMLQKPKKKRRNSTVSLDIPQSSRPRLKSADLKRINLETLAKLNKIPKPRKPVNPMDGVLKSPLYFPRLKTPVINGCSPKEIFSPPLLNTPTKDNRDLTHVLKGKCLVLNSKIGLNLKTINMQWDHCVLQK